MPTGNRIILLSFFISLACTGPSLADMYVADDSQIVVLADNASGDASAVRTIAGDDTLLGSVRGVVLDVSANELFVAPSLFEPVAVFPADGDGNLTPLRTLNSGCGSQNGLALDASNDELYVVCGDVPPSILVFSSSASGSATPLRTITGDNTGLNYPTGIFVDLVSNEIFVASQNNDSVRVFSRLANGDVAPLRTLAGEMTGFVLPQWVFISTIHDELYVSDRVGTVSVFSRTASDNTAPLRIIAGEQTGLNFPQGFFLNTNDELVVAQEGGQILFFSRTANGNVEPVRSITNGAAGFTGNLSGMTGNTAAEGAAGMVGQGPLLFEDGFEDP